MIEMSMTYQIGQKGFSIIEILLAGALFTLFAWAATDGILMSLETNRLGRETTIATEFASEGIEEVRAIKERNFNDMVESSGTGIDRQSDFFVFSGTENTFEKYTRVIVIEPGFRDGSGAIVESGGDEDPDTFRVTVTVSWKVTPTRNNSVVVNTYMTHFH